MADVDKTAEKRIEKNTKMPQNQALNVLVQAAYIGQSKGAYTIKEANAIYQAIDSFTVENKT